jgi:hypothetical protein
VSRVLAWSVWLAALLTSASPPGAVDAVAASLARDIQAAHPEGPVALVVSAASPALGAALSSQLAARLAEAHLGPVVGGGGTETARTLVTLRVWLDSELHAAGELRPARRNFWAGRTPVRPSGPVAVLAASATADAPARLLAAAGLRGGTLSVDDGPLARLPGHTAALAVGDLDGDGVPEVAALCEGEVWILGPDGQVRARQPLAALAPAPAPAREPFGTLCIAAGRLAVTSARNEGGLLLQLDRGRLVTAGTLPGPTLGCGTGAPAAAFVPGQARFREVTTATSEVLWGAGLQDGHRLALLPDGTARWTLPDGRRRLLPDVGAGAALVPWEGEVRLAASSSAADPARDRLRLLRFEGGPALEVDVPGRILQVAPAPPGTGAARVLVATWTSDGGSELRWVRDGP